MLKPIATLNKTNKKLMLNPTATLKKQITGFLSLALLSTLSLAFKWDNFTLKRETSPPLKIKTLWTVDTVDQKKLSINSQNNSPPLVTNKLVIQGNLINGLKAYEKTKGELVWHFKMAPGVTSPLLLKGKNLYFGGADGFFYSLQWETGLLNWKFWTGSENSSQPLIHQNKIYWTANNQKLYALDLKGQLIWVYSGPSLTKDFMIRGRPGPLVFKNTIYTGFYPGSLVALNKNTGQLKWKKTLSATHSLKEDFKLSGNCLFVPVFDFYLFCLKASSGEILWKAKGGSAFLFDHKSVIYHTKKDKLYALKKFNGQELWSQNIKPHPLRPSLFKEYLVYGWPHAGYIVFLNKGQTVAKHYFGKGLSAPVTVDLKNNHLYFFSVGGYLHKLSVL